MKEYQNKSNADNEMAYDVNGNLIKDLDRDIVTIKYNLLNLPDIIQFKNGNQITNKYDAGGRKLSTKYFTLSTPIVVPIGQTCVWEYDLDNIDETGTFYIDNKEYGFNGCDPGVYWLNRINNAEGYYSFEGTVLSNGFMYYRRDHLGNNREVWNATNNTTVQRTQYYPSGLPWAESTGTGVQNRKYNGKEFVEMHGLDEYDSEARWFYPAIMRTTTIDPLAEKYYSISPYAWCVNNPVKFLDPDGEDVIIWYKDSNSKSGMSSYRYNGGEVKSSNSYVTKAINSLNYNINNGNKINNGGGDPSENAVYDKSLTINIYETEFQSFHDPGNNTVYWNSELGNKTDNGIVRSPASVLDHELDHAVKKILQRKVYYDGLDTYDKQYGDKEEQRVITGSEQATATANGEIEKGQKTRTNHKGNFVITKGATSTKINTEKTNKIRSKINEHNKTWTSE